MKSYLTYYFTFILLIFIISKCTAQNQVFEMLDKDVKGIYDVGVKFIKSVDYSRSFKENQGRSLDYIIWYPTDNKTNKKVKLEEYLLKNGSDISYWNDYFSELGDQNISLKELFNSTLISRKNAKSIENKKFPMIVYSPGAYGSEYENYIICEYLASNGYIVASHQSKGPNSLSTKITTLGLESQARDIEYGISEMQKQISNVNTEKIGLFGWSWGGLASMLVQLRNKNIDALISIDGSIAIHKDKIEETSFFNTQEIDIPYLFVSSKSTSKNLKEFLVSLKYSESIYLGYSNLEHKDYNSLSFLKYSNISRDKKNSYIGLVKNIVNFFNNHLKVKEFELLINEIKKQETENLVNYEILPSLEKPIGTERFFELFKDKKAEMAMDIFENTLDADLDYNFFEEEEAINFSYELYYDFDLPNEAIELLKMSIISYPNYYRTYGHLGNLSYKMGDLKSALIYFSKASGMINKTTGKDYSEDLKWYEKSIDKIKSKIK